MTTIHNFLAVDHIVTEFSNLPDAIKNGVNPIPTYGDDLCHAYNTYTGQWMAFCTCCEQHTEDSSNVPASDYLCPECWLGCR